MRLGVCFCAALCIFVASGVDAYPQSQGQSKRCPEPQIAVKPVDGGYSRIEISDPCRANQQFVISYAGYVFVRQLDPLGGLTLIWDCFAGDKPPIVFHFRDGGRYSQQLAAKDLDRVAKVAVLWQGAINLDLHAYEFAAAPGTAGHVWQAAPRSHSQAVALARRERRSRGFMSSVSAGEGSGDHLEVYTLIYDPSQHSGAIATALDYESRFQAAPRPETCDRGFLSEAGFDVVIMERNAVVSKSSARFASINCGETVDASRRYLSKAVPDIFLR